MIPKSAKLGMVIKMLAMYITIFAALGWREIKIPVGTPIPIEKGNDNPIIFK